MSWPDWFCHKSSHIDLKCDVLTPDSWQPIRAWQQASRPMGGGGVKRIEQSTLFWQRPPKTFHPDSYQTVNPHQVWSKPGLVRTVHQEQEQNAVQLWRHMVPTDTFTLCPVLSPTAPNPFQFDQYQSLKWLSGEIKTYENKQQGRVLMQISGNSTKQISFNKVYI